MPKTVKYALNNAYAAMVEHETAAGASPLDAVNVERLFSEIRLLRGRRDHEAAPFVNEWKPTVEAADRHPVRVSDQEVINAISRGLMNRGFGDVVSRVEQIVRSITSPGDGTVYREVEASLMAHTAKRLSETEDVAYLQQSRIAGRTHETCRRNG